MVKHRLWITVLLAFSLSLNACVYAHSGEYKIVKPDAGQVFQLGESVKIFVRLPGAPNSRYTVFLDGRRLTDTTVPSGHNTDTPIEYIYVLTSAQAWAGYHRVDARIRLVGDTTWRPGHSVCFFIQDTGENSVVPGGLSDCNVAEDIVSRAYPIEAAPQNQSPEGTLGVSITAPSDNSIMYMQLYRGFPIALSVRTDQPANRWVLYTNQGVVTDNEISNPASFVAINWNVPGPGLYILSVAAYNSQLHLSGRSNSIRVCVMEYGTDATDPGIPYGYTGECPPQHSETNSTDPVSLWTTVQPLSLAENFQCDATPPLPVLTFRSVLTDPASRTALVTVAYGGRTNGSSSTFDPQNLVLNPIGGNVYYGSTDSSPITLANLANIFSGMRLGSENPRTVQWTAKAWGSRGELLAVDGPHEIPVNPCFVLPEPTETPVPPVPVQNNPNQQGTGCSQYHSQTSCNLAGCSWNPQNSTCSVAP